MKYEDNNNNVKDETNLDNMFHIVAVIGLLGIYMYLSSTITLDSNHPLSETFFLLSAYYH